jgi:hypothetical protein
LFYGGRYAKEAGGFLNLEPQAAETAHAMYHPGALPTTAKPHLPGNAIGPNENKQVLLVQGQRCKRMVGARIAIHPFSRTQK